MLSTYFSSPLLNTHNSKLELHQSDRVDQTEENLLEKAGVVPNRIIFTSELWLLSAAILAHVQRKSSEC